jgi:transcriptional regulator with XRE-family HTH domain/uncharacterized protein YuzE
MELKHDPDADALYVRFTESPWDRTKQLDDARHIDYVADGTVIGIEILGVRNGVDVVGLPRAAEVADLLRRHGIKVAGADEVAANASAALATDLAWERTAFARAVGRAVAEHRKRHGLGVRELARRLKMSPSAVVRLEIGEHNPSVDILRRLARTLEVRFVLDVSPASRSAGVTIPEGLEALSDVIAADGSRVLVAAG